jgi:diacylglycerol kinase (ATP)
MAAPRPGRPPNVLDSFNYAFEGIIHVLRTQRNMRIHFLAAAAVLIAAIAIGVSRLELMALMISIAFVLIAEMTNTAIEGAVDVSTTSFDPNAKLAKDIAAGAVLIATVNAVAVGYLIFSNRIVNRSSHLIDNLRDAPAQLTLVALVLTVLAVIATKAYTGRGTPLRGGLPSGHAAVAFGGWMGNSALARADDALDGGRPAAAADRASLARAWMPWSPAPWLDVGKARLEAGDRAGARQAFRHALSLDSGSWEAWAELATVSRGRTRTAAIRRAAALNHVEPVVQRLESELVRQPAGTR